MSDIESRVKKIVVEHLGIEEAKVVLRLVSKSPPWAFVIAFIPDSSSAVKPAVFWSLVNSSKLSSTVVLKIPNWLFIKINESPKPSAETDRAPDSLAAAVNSCLNTKASE